MNASVNTTRYACPVSLPVNIPMKIFTSSGLFRWRQRSVGIHAERTKWHSLCSTCVLRCYHCPLYCPAAATMMMMTMTVVMVVMMTVVMMTMILIGVTQWLSECIRPSAVCLLSSPAASTLLDTSKHAVAFIISSFQSQHWYYIE